MDKLNLMAHFDNALNLIEFIRGNLDVMAHVNDEEVSIKSIKRVHWFLYLQMDKLEELFKEMRTGVFGN